MIKKIWICGFLIFIRVFVFCQVPVFDQRQAFDYLEKQCSFGPRNPGSDAHEKCLKFIIDELKKYSSCVEKQTFRMTLPLGSNTYQCTNVMASFGQQSKRILLCAHWDTRPRADHDPNPENRNTPILGANDGASGVAVLLELARILHNHRAPIGIELVFFDAEDAGLDGQPETWCLGSKYFAESGWLTVFPQYAILLDLIGDRDLLLPIEHYSSLYAPSYVDQIWSRAEDLGLSAFVRSKGPAVIDDHLNLLKIGIPSVDIIDFDYTYWHTVEDTPDKCSPESLQTIGTVLLHLIYDPE
ncbi:M28 family peptidase [bacterium]|nr:M28 family peptidase [bacterium]